MEKDDGIVNHVKGLRFAGDVAGGEMALFSLQASTERERFTERKRKN
jgi:hypothetical protein